MKASYAFTITSGKDKREFQRDVVVTAGQTLLKEMLETPEAEESSNPY